MAAAIYDDKRTYYHSAGGTSWVLPAESFAEFEANQDPGVSPQLFEDDDAKEDAATEEVADDEGVNDQWVVRLHPDSGQIFYHSHVDSMSTWNNPYEEGAPPLQCFARSPPPPSLSLGCPTAASMANFSEKKTCISSVLTQLTALPTPCRGLQRRDPVS